MDYPHENDLRQIARPDGRRVLESWIAGTWRELVGIEIVGTRLQDSGATAHLTLSVKLPCIITMPASRRMDSVPAARPGVISWMDDPAPPRMEIEPTYPNARTRADLEAAKAASFADDAAALATEIAASNTEPCAIVIEEDGAPVGVVEGDVVTGDGSGAALPPFSGALKEAAANDRARREAIERRYSSHVLDDRPQLLGDELIEPRGGRYPAKRGR